LPIGKGAEFLGGIVPSGKVKDWYELLKLWPRFRRIVAIPVNNGGHLARQLLTPENPAAGAHHWGNPMDGLRHTSAAIAVSNIL
jgi:hypothetical protein